MQNPPRVLDFSSKSKAHPKMARRMKAKVGEPPSLAHTPKKGETRGIRTPTILGLEKV